MSTRGFDNLWAGWRSEYLERGDTPGDGPGPSCVMCRLAGAGLDDEEAGVVWRAAGVTVALNAYPYTSGHVMVMPDRHVGDLELLAPKESVALWATVADAVRAIKSAYRPDGVNVGANLGHAAGAGIPGHLHVHVLPRWVADTNFMTTVASARVLPEALPVTWRKLREAWPQDGPGSPPTT